MDKTPEKIAESLLPGPYRLTLLSADYPLDESCSIVCMTPTASCAGERLSNMIAEEWGLHLPVRNKGTDGECVLYVTGDQGSLRLPASNDLKVDAFLGEEYHLRVDSNGAVIRARTTRALLWGTMTLRQLITSRDHAVFLCGVEIQDRPHYDLRGFMVDSGRAPNSLPKLKRIIRICSAFKLNALFFREGDDEMNAVRYSTNKLGSLNPFAFSLEELGELSTYARMHGITLIPEVESLGHSTAKGIHYPELVSGGFEENYEGIGSHMRESHLAPCNPKTFELLESVYDELFAALPQPFIHLGLDEVRLPTETQVRHMAELLRLVFQCADRYGMQASPVVWSDAPETPDEHKDHVYRCLWEYGDGGAIGLENEHLAKQGIDMLSQQHCRQRVLMAGGSGSGHTPYSKSSYEAAYSNLAAWAKWGIQFENYVGLFAVQWSGNMTDEWLPDFLAAADFGWTPPKSTPPHDYLDKRIREHLSRLTDTTDPQPEEVDRPAWDGIWLKENQWDKEILTTGCTGLRVPRSSTQSQ